MKFLADHDYHIHSYLSYCSADPKQTPADILRHAKENHLAEICLTDHFWDAAVPLPTHSGFYNSQDLEHIQRALPLPQDETVKFMFGCETELSENLTLGISRETMEQMDFIIIPTTHLHMRGFTISAEDSHSYPRVAERWAERFDAVLDMDLPFHKVGIPHLTCPLIADKSFSGHIAVIGLIPEKQRCRLFEKAAKKGVGIELNLPPSSKYSPGDYQQILDVYRTAKKCGCKFYLGSDAHHPERFTSLLSDADEWITELDLTQNDRFRIK